MMRIYRRKGSKKWQIDYSDQHGRRVRETAYTDKAASEKLLRDRVRAVERCLAGLPPEDDRTGQSVAVKEMAQAFLDFQKADGVSPKWIQTCRFRLMKLVRESDWRVMEDITTASAEAAIRCVGQSPSTLRQYQQLLKTWLGWCTKAGHLAQNPVENLPLISKGIRETRRALTEAELSCLLHHAPASRSLKYRFLVFTGLRRTEAKLATWDWLDLEAEQPFLTIPAIASKSKKADTIPLHESLIGPLRTLKADNKAQQRDRIFDSIPEVETYRRDCVSAGVDAVDASGRPLTLHGLRTTFATMLCRSGVPAAVARVLLRHSDVRLTLEIYTDLVPKDAAEGIAKLHVVPPGVPNLVPNDAQTGTSSRPRGSMPLKRSQGHADTCASEHDPAPVPRVGLEPTTR